jgi:prephenate dehydrogenase
MSVCDSAAVIGLGLIGGSVARDLAARGVRVYGFDADPAQLAAAVGDGVVAESLDASLAGVRDVELVVIAVPVDAALSVLRTIAPAVRALGARTTLVTDVGSTKGKIVALAAEVGIGPLFVGSHPMAGDHRSGWSASRDGLFQDAPVYLCPSVDASPSAVAMANALWADLGATTIDIDAAEHDRKLAWTSHLPHIIAATLGLALACGGVTRDDLGPGGRAMTRIAGSSPGMWTAIAMENAAAIDETLAAAERELARFRSALRRCDEAAVRAQFADAREWFDQTG